MTDRSETSTIWSALRPAMLVSSLPSSSLSGVPVCVALFGCASGVAFAGAMAGCAVGVRRRAPPARMGRPKRPQGCQDEQHRGDNHQRQYAEEYVKAAVGVPAAPGAVVRRGRCAPGRCAPGAAAGAPRRPRVGKAARRERTILRRPGTGGPCAVRRGAAAPRTGPGRCGGRRSDMVSISSIVVCIIRTIIHAIAPKINLNCGGQWRLIATARRKKRGKSVIFPPPRATGMSREGLAKALGGELHIAAHGLHAFEQCKKVARQRDLVHRAGDPAVFHAIAARGQGKVARSPRPRRRCQPCRSVIQQSRRRAAVQSKVEHVLKGEVRRLHAEVGRGHAHGRGVPAAAAAVGRWRLHALLLRRLQIVQKRLKNAPRR